MIKSIFVLFVVLATGVFLAQTQRLRCPTQCRSVDSGARRTGICIIHEDGITCRRLRRCQMREENCRLLAANQTLLRRTSLRRCRTIQTMNVPARCVGTPCSALRCTDIGNVTSCFRNPSNQCQLLTQCQQRRQNCQLDPQNILTIVEATRCRGMTAGEALRTCQA